MSSRDFPGPSWQDRSQSPDGPSEYLNGNGDYGRAHDAGWSANDRSPGQSGYGRQRDDDGRAGYPASRDRGASGRASGRGYEPGGYDGGRGAGGNRGYENQENSGYDYPGNGYGRNGNGYPGNGSADNGSAGNGYASNGRRGRKGPGRRSDKYADDGYAGNGYGRNGYDRNGYGGNGQRSEDYDRDRSGYAGRVASRRGSGRPDAPEGWPGGGYDDAGLYRPEGPYGSGGGGYGPDGPRWRRGLAGRNVRDLVRSRPGGRPGRPPVPGNWLQRQWRANWWRHWTLKKAGLVSGGVAATMALVMIAGFFVAYSSVRVPIAALSQPLQQASMVFFSNGRQIGCFCAVDRTVLTEDQIKQSKNLVAAVLAAEDRNFFNEGGVSVNGIMRAAKADLTGGAIQGGSTITEQFVKKYYDPSGLGNLSYSTKVKEIFVAMKLAKMESKWWILTHYLNFIYLGSGAWGAEAAAQTYFGRPAWKLTVPQAAMIAAMIQAPGQYDPLHPTAVVPYLGNSLLDRWVYVLGNMQRDGVITQQQLNALAPDITNASNDDLKYFPKVLINPPDSNWPGYRGYVMSLVENELQANYGISPSQIGSMGLQIHTTINERLMNGLYAAVRQNKQLMASYGVPLPSYVHIGAVLEKPGTGKILAFYGGPGFGVKHCSELHCKLDTILAAEPVGSSFKPYVLATAVSQGMNVQTSILNSHSPLCIPPDWTPTDQLQLSKQTKNCNTSAGYWLFNESSEDTPGRNLGVPVATASSNDPAYEDLIHRTTVQAVINMAQALGVSSYDVAGLNALFGPHGEYPGAVNSALGEGSLTAVDQANTFATLASGGISVTPHVIDYVVQDGVQIPNKIARARALQPAVAADTDYALSFDTNAGMGGTGYPNAVWDRPFIAKTGTLGTGASASMAWFIGAIPQYSLSVGMFTDRPYTKPPQILDGLASINGVTGGYGGAWPAHIWQTFMSNEFTQANLPVKQFPQPSYTGTDPVFVKWNQAPPIKKKTKCQIQQGGGGNGNGNGHGHGPGQGPGPIVCLPGTGPTQSPGPTSSPSPGPSGTSSPSPSPSPSGSVSPSPSPSLSRGKKAALPQSPAQQSALLVSGLTAVATVPRSPLRRTAWTATTSLLL